MQHGDFTHIEIPADEPERARGFYREVFGWTFPPEIPGYEGYHMFTTPAGEEGLGGAIGKRGEMAPEQVRIYINVSSVDEVLTAVEAHGGAVVAPKSEVPGMGWFGVFRDSEGNELAVWESTPAG